jgi:polysaccharide biosynthesis protein PslH
MNILFVVPYTPSLTRVRSYQLLRGLARRGHAVTLATVWQSERDRQGLDALRADGIGVRSVQLTAARSFWNCVRAIPGREPLQAHYCWHPGLGGLLRSALAEDRPDVVHVEHLRGAAYGIAAQTANRVAGGAVPVVWDSVDCISLLFEQSSKHGRGIFTKVFSRLELPRTRWYEGWLANGFDSVVVTSPVDKACLETLAENQHRTRGSVSSPPQVTLVPNGVDMEYFRPASATPEMDTLVYLGRMSYHANVAAATHLAGEIMPLIWRERPGTKLWIVGENPARELRALAAREPSRILLSGTVPDVRPYLWRAAVMVAPMVYGAGIQNKILEGMASGVPVVCSQTATAALQAKAGQDLLVADSASDAATSVLGLLGDSSRRAQLSRAGRKYVETHHDWDQATARLEQVYLQAIATRAGRRSKVPMSQVSGAS